MFRLKRKPLHTSDSFLPTRAMVELYALGYLGQEEAHTIVVPRAVPLSHRATDGVEDMVRIADW